MCAKQVETSTADIDDCRVREVGVQEYAECLCEGPNTCEYALPFGYAFLCRHPQLANIRKNSDYKEGDVASAS